MQGVSLTHGGAQGEFAGVAMIGRTMTSAVILSAKRFLFLKRHMGLTRDRCHVRIHGEEIPVTSEGDVDLTALKAVLSSAQQG